ncbi:STAS domain-containing protein [Chloroflexus islandicus]|uniref:STAS domain-containing protein n=1 Tax=Chloroflexus islandicus TaxID=1707952 RepID=UPI000829ED14|nr:STAS domain-containing protein [Chloroflexus islandicus]
MEPVLILFNTILLTASLVYILLQDWKATANRLFVLLTLFALAWSGGGVLLYSNPTPSNIWFLAGLLPTMLAATFGSLIALILVLFIPHRYEQPAVRWAILAPYMVVTVILAVSWYGHTGWFIRDVTWEAKSGLTFVPGPAFPLALILFVIGGFSAPLSMLITIAIRHRSFRAPVLWLIAGLTFNFLTGSAANLLDIPALTYLNFLPLHFAFGWVTLRYGIFLPSHVALQAAIESLPDGIVVLQNDRQVRFANRAAQQLLPTCVGQPFEQALAQAGLTAQTGADPNQQGLLRLARTHGHAQVLIVTEVAMTNARGKESVVLLRDVTMAERQQAELLASRAALAERTAELERSLAELQQRDALLRRLTLPIIPLSETVLLVPLIGAFDATRCQTLVSLILPEIAARNVRTVLVDLTGLTVFDQDLARALRQLSDGARLMGAQVALCGIRPDMAEVMIHTGSTWNGMRSFGTLQAGVKALLASGPVTNGQHPERNAVPMNGSFTPLHNDLRE